MFAVCVVFYIRSSLSDVQKATCAGGLQSGLELTKKKDSFTG